MKGIVVLLFLAMAVCKAKVIITEIVITGDNRREFIEVYNSGTSTVDLNGWTIEAGTDSHTISGSVELAVGDYKTLGRNNNPTFNGGITHDHRYGDDLNFLISSSPFSIILRDGGGLIEDNVTYTEETFPYENTFSLSRRNIDNTLDSSDGSNWCRPANVYSTALNLKGTPAAANDCAALTDKIVINEIFRRKRFRMGANSEFGEWFELYNTDETNTIDLIGWAMQSQDETGVFRTSTPVPPKSYVVIGRRMDPSENGDANVNYTYPRNSPFLDDDADSLVILDRSDREVDRVDYDGGPEFPDVNFRSLSLRDPSLDNNNGSNWCRGLTLFGAPEDNNRGTPGTENDCINTTIQLIVTEILKTASNATGGEWFEIYNPNTFSVDLNGWAFSNNAFDDTHVVSTSVSVGALSYVVLGRNSDTATNGGVNVDYRYNIFEFNEIADSIVLRDTNDVEVDRVEYADGDTFPDLINRAMALRSIAIDFDNNNGTNWCRATTIYGPTVANRGTPGMPNDCRISNISLVINEIQRNGRDAFNGEWIELYNPNSEDVDLDGWVLSSEGVDHYIVSSVIVEAYSYVVLGRNMDNETNGGVDVDYQYGLVELMENADSLILLDMNDMPVDRVDYDIASDFPISRFRSLSLRNVSSDNNVGSNWCKALTRYGPSFNFGTPGRENDCLDLDLLFVMTITEIMKSAANGGNVTFGEYFEMFNPSPTESVNLNGWTFSKADGSDPRSIDDDILVPPRSYVLLGRNSDSSTNSGYDIDYDFVGGNFFLNLADSIVLFDPNDKEVDRVEYDNGPNFPMGMMRSLSLIVPGLDNNVGSNWCDGSTDYGYAGFLGTPGEVNDCFQSLLISEVQGNGNLSPKDGENVAVEGIVTGVFQDSEELQGFFIQSKDEDVDADPMTSEGIFVHCGACVVNVTERDLVQVSGLVSEVSGQTQINVTVIPGGNVEVISSENPLPTPITLSLPLTAPFDDDTVLEQYESMLVQFSDTLTIADSSDLAKMGQIILYQGGRPESFTESNTPDLANYNMYLEELKKRTVVLDDTSNTENYPVVDMTAPFAAYWPQPGGFNVTNFFRSGDTVTSLVGVLSWSLDTWRVRPTSLTLERTSFNEVNSRTASPDNVGGSLKVATFNLVAYFAPVARRLGIEDGADSSSELTRQRDKIVAALDAINADIVGLIGIENDGDGAATMDLISGLAGSYDFVDTGILGSDDRRVAFIYKNDTVELEGMHAVLDSSTAGFTYPSVNRPTLAQSFRDKSKNAFFTVCLIDLAARDGTCTVDPDTGDGSGACNDARTSAANAIVNWVQTNPTNLPGFAGTRCQGQITGDLDVLIIGNMNAYSMEDPVNVFESSTVLRNLIGSGVYGSVLDGQTGNLHHAFATSSMEARVVGSTIWNINADEVNLLDYIENGKPMQSVLYNDDAYRSAEQDPLIVGIDLLRRVETIFFPLSSINTVNWNLRNYGLAIYSSPTFDPTVIDVSSLRLNSPRIINSTELDGSVQSFNWDAPFDDGLDDLLLRPALTDLGLLGYPNSFLRLRPYPNIIIIVTGEQNGESFEGCFYSDCKFYRSGTCP